MSHAALADATDLANWANRIEAQSRLPLVLRRLVHATAPNILRVGFPAGDAVQLPGWDGIVETSEESAFVPNGVSVWEMGTNRDVKGKADADYEKRCADPLGVDPASSTFIFVSLRRWRDKDEWARARAAEGIWREVRVYDADSLEEWLGLAPAVHTWLSCELGKFSEEAIDLGTSWLDWAECTAPALTTEMVLAGRNRQQEQIVAWLSRETPQTLTIRAESRQEAQAIFAAAIIALPAEQRAAYLSRSILVGDASAWNRLVANSSPLFLVPMFDAPEAVARATRFGHRVVICLGRSDIDVAGSIEVPPVAPEVLGQALRATGMPEEQAGTLALLAKRSLTSFRRQISRYPEIQVPVWARAEEGPRLVPFLLAGAWITEREADCDVISALARTPYAEIEPISAHWSTTTDPLLRSVGHTRYLLSKEDAWRLLSRYITREHLAVLEQVILSEFSTADARFDLPPGERWYAPKPGGISGRLREGLADTLILLAAHDQAIGNTTGQEFARACVRRLLQSARGNWKIWASLPLTLLAEAAPEEFLDAVEEGLQGENPILLNQFETDGDPLFSTSPHTYLLWALEIVAWSPEYLGRAAHQLAKLTRLDPGGRTGNRPMGSLTQIFLFWHAQTSASFQQRLQVLDRLRQWEPDVSWRLFIALLPTGHSTGSRHPMPRWRDWAPRVRPISYSRKEFHNGVCQIARFLIADAGTDVNRLNDLISNLDRIPREVHGDLMDLLAKMDLAELDDQALLSAWNGLRSLISKHRSYPDAVWALPSEILDELAALVPRFEPRAVTLRCAWLFSERPELIDGREDDWDAYQAIVAERRQTALHDVLTPWNLEVLAEFVTLSTSPWDLGVALGNCDLLNEARGDELLRVYLAAADQRFDAFARGIVYGCVQRHGDVWWRATIARLWNDLSSEQQARFLLQLPQNRDVFDLAETSPQTDRAYWRLVRPHSIDLAERERTIRKLIFHGRPFNAIERLDFLARQAPPLSARFVVEALQLMLAANPEDERPSHTFSYHLSQLLTRLESAQDVSEDELAALEWALLPLMEGAGRPRAQISPPPYQQGACLLCGISRFGIQGRGSRGSRGYSRSNCAGAQQSGSFGLLGNAPRLKCDW